MMPANRPAFALFGSHSLKVAHFGMRSHPFAHGGLWSYPFECHKEVREQRKTQS